jgi:hypothetical protein
MPQNPILALTNGWGSAAQADVSPFGTADMSIINGLSGLLSSSGLVK